jgi:ElaB/YqjD/DUF883 family membrane-anchored ribosome-binding protein
MNPDTPLWSADQTTTPEAPDAEVGELIEDIEVTRVELMETADELGRRLDPATLVENAKQTARDATVGKVEAMATQAGDVVSDVGMQARETGTGIIETMRRNPVPTALAGIGIAWLWMSRNPDGRRQVRYVGGNGWNESGMTYRSGARRWDRDASASGPLDAAGDRVSDAAEAASRRAGEFVDDARRTFDEVGPEVRTTVEDVGETARRVVEENPLAAGAIALAVGTAVGLAMPATRIEQDLMGDAGSRVIDQAQEAAAKPLEKAERAIREATPAGTVAS